MAMILTKCLNSQCRYASLLSDPSPMKLTTFLLDDLFDKSLSSMLQSGPASFFFVRARSAVLSRDGTAQSN